MTVFTIDVAETQLASLVARARAGEEIVLTEGERTVARIVPTEIPNGTSVKKRHLGGYKGLISYDDDVFKPLTDEQMKEYGFE